MTEENQEHAATTPTPLAYRQYVERGFRVAHAMLRHVDDAEETVQEAFCRLIQAEGLETGGFEPRFFRTLRNLAIDKIRGRPRRRSVPLDEAAHAPTQDALPDDSLPLAARIAALMDELPERQRSALALRVHGGLGYDAIAAALDASSTQVRTWIFRARRHLERALRHEGVRTERTYHGRT